MTRSLTVVFALTASSACGGVTTPTETEIELTDEPLEWPAADETEEAEADATPSYLMPATRNMPPPQAAEQVDEYGLPSAPIGNQ